MSTISALLIFCLLPIGTAVAQVWVPSNQLTNRSAPPRLAQHTNQPSNPSTPQNVVRTPRAVPQTAPPNQNQVELPLANIQAPVIVSAEEAKTWRQGSYDVWWLKGQCEVRQGNTVVRGREAVLWVDAASRYSNEPHKVLAYVEQDVVVEHFTGNEIHNVSGRAAQTIQDKQWFGRFQSVAGVDMRVTPKGHNAETKPAIYNRGLAQQQLSPNAYPQKPGQFPGLTVQRGGVQTAQFIDPQQVASGVRRIRAFPRSSVPVQIKSFRSDDGTEQVVVIDSGINIVIDAEGGQVAEIGTIDLAADRIVVWTAGIDASALGGGQTDQQNEQQVDGDRPLEFYMEGNIVFRQGERVVYAQRMYYNVKEHYGLVLDAELLTPVEEYEGLLRLRADVIQQLNDQNFKAYRAAVTSSRLGVPSYWLQSDELEFVDVQFPAGTAAPETVPTPYGERPVPVAPTRPGDVEHALFATSRNNWFYLGEVPLLYWPVLATDLTRPTYYLNNLSVRTDNVFGVQILTEFDLYQVFGVRQPPIGTDLSASFDFLSERGPAAGVNLEYSRNDCFGLQGPAFGEVDAWGIYDTGLDNLGRDRQALTFPDPFRGRVRAFHRQELVNGWQVTGELGFISDRNFLEQYFENEWDTEKDQITGIELKRYWNNQSFSATADVRINDFFTQTESLPRLDHFLIGQSLLADTFTFHAHSHIGYARMETADPPTDPVELAKWGPLPYQADREGLNAASRGEISLPLNAGPFKVAPYLLGEVAYWHQDLAGNEVTRTLGQAGVRASLPIWAADPQIRSELFNFNGLAHKVIFDADLFHAEASQDLSTLPLYDPIDDDSVEAFRRRFPFDDFGGPPPVPIMFDERYYAVRSGLQKWVSSPSTEIAEDLTVLQLGVRQRLQTKRGLPGQQRIVDWIEFDVQSSFFPNAAADNFDSAVGLMEYDFTWHVGDRLTILSDGFADFFGNGLRAFTVGGLISRPEVGDVYIGFRTLEGPISSNILTSSFTYRLSEKWIAGAGASYDLGPTGNIGQTFFVTRIGESFLFRFGVNVDASRDNIGFQLALEPRFLPSRLGELGGVRLPPAGSRGLE